MGNSDFDERYPAMFQPGGETGPDEWPAPEPEAVDVAAPVVPPQVPAPEAVSTSLAPKSTEVALEPLPGRAGEEDRRGVQEVSQPAPEPVRHWNGRAWLQGLGVSVAVMAAGLFCWTAQLLMGGGRHYTRRSHWLRAVVLTLGLVAAALAWMALTSSRLFVEQFYSQSQQFSEDEAVIEWPHILNMSVTPLILLALGILAAWVIVGPNGRISSSAALGVAAVLLVSGLLGTFSTQLFPVSGALHVVTLEDLQIQLQPWTQFWNQASPQILAVAAAALLCPMVVRAAARERSFAASNEEREPEPAKESAA